MSGRKNLESIVNRMKGWQAQTFKSHTNIRLKREFHFLKKVY